jgi:hypothetical protein
MKIFLVILLLALSLAFQITEEPSSLSTYNAFRSKTIAVYSSLSFCNSSCLLDWSCQDSPLVPKLLNVTVMTKSLSQANGYVGYSPADDTIVVSFRGTDNIANWI